MSDLERTSSWNGLEIIEEADELKKAAATDEVNDSEGKNETPDKASSSSDGSDSNGSAGNGPENKQEPRRQLTPQERRAERQKRRKKSRMIAFAVFAVLVIITAIGAGFGIKALNEKKAAEQPQFPVVEELPVEEEKTVVDMTPVITQEVEEEEPEEEKEPEQTKDELLDEMIESMIAEMTLEDKVAGLFVVTPESLTGQSAVTKAGDGTKKALEQYPVGGVIYFKQNISSSDQIKEMIDNTVSYCRYPLFIAVDEEGGDVARVREALKLEKTPTAQELGENNSFDDTKNTYKEIGSYLAEYGFNLDFAPVGDVLTNPDNKAIGNRSFGEDAALVSDMVGGAIDGLHESNMVTCVKHFPGQGGADADTHQTLASISGSRADMEACELIPFKTAIEHGVDMIMVGHVSTPGITDDGLPASLSKAIMTDMLRVDMEYNGVIITDSMSMAAISEYYGADEAAIKALKAGADMILMPEDFEIAYKGVIHAVNEGTIDEKRIDDSLARVYRIKYRDELKDDN